MASRLWGRSLLVTTFCVSAVQPFDAQKCTSRDQVLQDSQIPDPGLRRAIRENLGKANDAPMTCGDLQGLTTLNARNHAIESLAGLDQAIALTVLDLGNNKIRDLTPLSTLEKVTNLQLDRNFIDDLRPLLKNSRIRNGVTVNVSRNCLDIKTATSTDLEALRTLEALRVAVDFTQQKEAADCPAPGAADQPSR